MSTSSVQTAQVLQFPVGGRKAFSQLVTKAIPANDLEVQAAAIAVGDAWYHAEAIQDAKRNGDR